MYVVVHTLIQFGNPVIVDVQGPYSSAAEAEKDILPGCEGCSVEQLSR